MKIRSQAEAARELGVSHTTVGEMVREGRIRTVKNPSNGRSKGLDEESFRLLRSRLTGCPTPAPARHQDEPLRTLSQQC